MTTNTKARRQVLQRMKKLEKLGISKTQMFKIIGHDLGISPHAVSLRYYAAIKPPKPSVISVEGRVISDFEKRIVALCDAAPDLETFATAAVKLIQANFKIATNVVEA